MSAELKGLIDRLERVVERIERQPVSSAIVNGSSSTSSSSSGQTHPSIVAFDALIVTKLKEFSCNSNTIGGEVRQVCELVERLFNLEKQFLNEAVKSAKPSDEILVRAIQPLASVISEIQGLKDKNRKSDYFNYLSAISESIGALGWITISPAPCSFIKEMSDAGQFYTNRVLKEAKEKNKDVIHTKWVQSWLSLLSDLQAYVKEYHTTGVSWNSRGSPFEATRAFPSNLAPTPATKPTHSPKPHSAPPPPPVPPMSIFEDESRPNPNSQSLITKLKQELNMGSEITKNLRKVKDEEKTHKNPALKAGNVVPELVKNVPVSEKKPIVVDKPPKFELIDKKWSIEYQFGNNGLVVDNTEIKQTVYIYKCKNSTVHVKGKVNSILLDSCERVGLLFDDVLSTVEFINSKNVQMQVTGRVPTVSIDKTDGCQVYLSKNSMDTEIISSKSSAMNVLLPTSEDNDYTEHPIPEQYKTVMNANGKLTTAPTESA